MREMTERSELDDGNDYLFESLDIEDAASAESSGNNLETAATSDQFVKRFPVTAAVYFEKNPHSLGEWFRKSSSDKNIIRPPVILSVGQNASKPKKAGGVRPLTLLQKLRPRYFFVSDFVAQSWCAQKAVMAIEHPDFEVEMEQLVCSVDKTVQPVIKTGTAIHEAREREVQVNKPVKIVTEEDRFAVKLLNMYTQLTSLLCGKLLQREVPIFGMPLELGVVIFGIIDEVRLDPTAEQLTLSETKTRNSERPPGSAQQKGHHLQIGLYRCLLKDFMENRVPWTTILCILRLDCKRPLSETVVGEINKTGVVAWNLDDLFRHVSRTCRLLPSNVSLAVEYVSQKTKKSFLVQEVLVDEQALREEMLGFLETWTGRRHLEGVSEKDAWKCQSCYFSVMCEWRLGKLADHASRTIL